MSVAAEEADPKTQAESEYTVTDTLVPEAQPERDALKKPATPDEAADKAEYILAILVAAKNGRTRPSQVQMARAVAMSLFGQRPLLVEGPTGTGKSLAYLAGALAFGKQTVIATHTKALQDQLRGDLEMLMGVLDSHLELWADDVLPTYAILKGRGAYACLDRIRPRDLEDQPPLDFDDASQASPSSAVGAEVAKLHDWVSTSDTGDRTDIPFNVSEKGWRAVSVTADACTGKRCRFFNECFAEQAKQKAASATIVIANQALLAMSMRLPILGPNVEAIIVDEAHEFESVVSGTFGTEVTVRRLEDAVKRAGALDAISAKTAAGKRDTASIAIAALARSVPVPKEFVNDRSILSGEPVIRALKAARNAFMDLREFSKSYPIKNAADQGKKDVLGRLFANVVSDIDILLLGTTDTQVSWVERNRFDAAVMKSAMFEVSDIIRERLIKEHRSVVFTSATLTIAGKFDSPIRTLGFAGTPFTTLAVESPFDFPKQGRLYHPMGIPLPGDNTGFYEAIAREVAEFAEAAGGRTMVLSTSWKGVRAISEELRRIVGRRLNVIEQQAGAGFKFLSDEFLENPASILVGTRTFWTGVSFEGYSCVITVVEKMPFPSPGDAIIGAKNDAAEERRPGSGFGEVSLPVALRQIEQGVGRAIRTERDRALVMVPDPRLNPNDDRKKGYARDFRRSIPAMPEVGKGEALEWVADIRRAAEASEAAEEVVEAEGAQESDDQGRAMIFEDVA